MDPELARMIRQADDAGRQRAGASERLRAHPNDIRRRVEFEMWEQIEFERAEAVRELASRLAGREVSA